MDWIEPITLPDFLKAKNQSNLQLIKYNPPKYSPKIHFLHPAQPFGYLDSHLKIFQI